MDVSYQKTIKKFSRPRRRVFLVESFSPLSGHYYQVVRYSTSLHDVIVSHMLFDLDYALSIFQLFCE